MVRHLPCSRPKPRTDLIKHALPLAFWLWIHEAGDYGGYSKQMVRRVRSRSFKTTSLTPTFHPLVHTSVHDGI